MKKTLSLLLLTSASLSSAQVVQTVPFAFTPNGTANLPFDKFDTQGGTRQLLSVVISVELNKLSGYTAVDNDSDTSGTITLTQFVSGQLSVVDNEVSLQDSSNNNIGAAGSLDITDTLVATVGPTTGDDTTTFDETGAEDFVSFSPPTATKSTSGSVHEDFISLYNAGADDDFELTFSADQSMNATGVSGLQQVFNVSNVTGNVTVTYNFAAVPVPEPTVPILTGLAALGLLRRRSQY